MSSQGFRKRRHPPGAKPSSDRVGLRGSVGLAWNPYAIPGLVGGALAILAAAFVFYVGSDRPAGRRLALVFLLEGINIACGTGLNYLADDLPNAQGFVAVAWTVRIMFVGVYLRFLATVGVPWLRVVERRWFVSLLIAVTIAAEIAFLLRPSTYLGAASPRWYAPWAFDPGDMQGPLAAMVIGVNLLGLAVAVSAYTAARSPTARRKAKAYALAFGVRDLLFVAFLTGLILLGPPVNDGQVRLEDLLFVWGAPVITLVYLPLIGYGILREHLFDIDVRLKRSIKPATVGAIFLGVFLVVTQVAQNGLSSRFGWVWGGIAAGLLVFALAPLVRFAERVANVTMPDVRATDEYFAHRRAEVYKSALEEMLADGEATPRERAVLKRLEEKLGLAPATVAALERDVLAARSA